MKNKRYNHDDWCCKFSVDLYGGGGEALEQSVASVSGSSGVPQSGSCSVYSGRLCWMSDVSSLGNSLLFVCELVCETIFSSAFDMLSMDVCSSI